MEVITKVEFVSMGIHSIAVGATIENDADQVAIDKIETEVEGNLLPIGSGFKLSYVSDSEGTLVYYPDTQKVNEKVDGTFKIESNKELDKLFVKLNFNNTESVYYVGADPKITPRTSVLVPRYWIADYTDVYAQMTKPKIDKVLGGMLITVDSKGFK